MEFEEALFASLRGLVADKCYPSTDAPDNIAPPYVLYELISDQEADRYLKGRVAHTFKRVQITAITRTYQQRIALCGQVRTAIEAAFTDQVYYHERGADLPRSPDDSTLNGRYIDCQIGYLKP